MGAIKQMDAPTGVTLNISLWDVSKMNYFLTVK